MKLLNGHKGGKLLIFENKNTLEKVDIPKARVDHRAVEEESRKAHNEEMKKKEDEDVRADEREQRVKKDRRDTERREAEAEESKKRNAVETTAKQAEEEDRKAKLATQAKEDKFKADEKQAREENEKKVAKQQEAVQKAQQEQAQKGQNKKNEEDQKVRSEQTEKASSVSLAAPWRPFGGEYQNPRVDIINGICYLTGLVAGEGGIVGTVPPDCRPSQGRLIFTVVKGDVNSRFDILEDGRIWHIAGGGSGWMSLNSIYYPVNIDRSIELLSGWVNYGHGYRATTVTKKDGLCMVSGLIRNGGWGYFGRVPSDCYPDGRLIFSGNNHAGVTRIDVLNNGYLLYSGGSADHGWVNLDGIAFVPGSGGSNLNLVNGWSNYDNSYRQARYARAGRVCSVSGLIRTGSWATTIAILPSDCRPPRRLIFGCNVHTRNARVDVLPDGQIQYINGRQGWDWLSLDTITFVVA